ncbi:hypothetical protein BY458DRAFT_525516 [Sporodiniella umbellata]|nr:hypothetical protein BY458DRAFT_525516 [Sporodiniella umbellata]
MNSLGIDHTKNAQDAHVYNRFLLLALFKLSESSRIFFFLSFKEEKSVCTENKK